MLAGALERDVLEIEEMCEALARTAHVLASIGVAEWPGGAVSGDYAFIHALYQEVIYRQLSPARKADIHRRLGASLEQGLGGQALDFAPTIGMHFEAGRESGKAIRYLSQAAESSARRFSVHEAEAYLSRALDLSPFLAEQTQAKTRLRLLLQRAWTFRAGGDFAAALGDLAAIVALAREAGDIREEIGGLVNLSRVQLFFDRRRCLEFAEEAVERAGASDEAMTGTLAAGNLANLRLLLLPWREDDAETSRHAELMSDDGQDVRARLRTYSSRMMRSLLSSQYAACVEATRPGANWLKSSATSIYTLSTTSWKPSRSSTPAAGVMCGNWR